MDAFHIIERLPLRPAKVQPGALLFDQQRARPKQIDEAVAAIQQFDALLVDGNLLALDAENLEKFIVEGLRLALFVMGMFLFDAESVGAPFDFVPAKPHASLPLTGLVQHNARFAKLQDGAAAPTFAGFMVRSRVPLASPEQMWNIRNLCRLAKLPCAARASIISRVSMSNCRAIA